MCTPCQALETLKLAGNIRNKIHFVFTQHTSHTTHTTHIHTHKNYPPPTTHTQKKNIYIYNKNIFMNGRMCCTCILFVLQYIYKHFPANWLFHKGLFLWVSRNFQRREIKQFWIAQDPSCPNPWVFVICVRVTILVPNWKIVAPYFWLDSASW